MKRIALAFFMSLSLPLTTMAAPVENPKTIMSSIQSPTRSKQLQDNLNHLQNRMNKATASEKQRLALVMDELYNDYYYTDALPAQQRRKWNFIRSNEEYVRIYKKMVQWPNKANGYYLAPTPVQYVFYFKRHLGMEHLPDSTEYERVMAQFDQQFYTKNRPTFTMIEQFYQNHYEELTAVRYANNQVDANHGDDAVAYHDRQVAEREKELKALGEAELQVKLQQFKQREWVHVSTVNNYRNSIEREEKSLAKQVAQYTVLEEVNDWYKEWVLPYNHDTREIEQLQIETMYVRPAYIEVKAKLNLLKRSVGSVGDFYEHYKHVPTAKFLTLYTKWTMLVKQDKWIAQSIKQVQNRLPYYDRVILGYDRAWIAAPLNTMDIDTMLNDLAVYENAYNTRMKQWLRELDNELNKK